MPIIKWTLAVVAALAVAVAGAYPATPPFLTFVIDRDCTLPDPGDSCLTRMRTLGHLWSRRGNLGQAEYWYGRAAAQDDAAAMFHLAWVHEELALGQLTDWLQRAVSLMEAGQFTAHGDTAPRARRRRLRDSTSPWRGTKGRWKGALRPR